MHNWRQVDLDLPSSFVYFCNVRVREPRAPDKKNTIARGIYFQDGWLGRFQFSLMAEGVFLIPPSPRVASRDPGGGRPRGRAQGLKRQS